MGSAEDPVKYKDYVEPDPVLGMLDMSSDQRKALQLCFEEVAKYSEPTEEEFFQAQK